MDNKLDKLTKEFLADILKFFEVATQIEVQLLDEDVIDVRISGDNLNYLIGYRGQSIDALADVLSHMLYKKTTAWPNLVLDINGYNQQRIERLHNLARRFIDRVRFFQTEVELPALNPWERKQIHMYIKDYDDVQSESRGDGRTRKMYLQPKKHKK